MKIHTVAYFLFLMLFPAHASEKALEKFGGVQRVCAVNCTQDFYEFPYRLAQFDAILRRHIDKKDCPSNTLPLSTELEKIRLLAKKSGLNTVYKCQSKRSDEFSSVLHLVMEHSIRLGDTRLLNKILTTHGCRPSESTIPFFCSKINRLIFFTPWAYLQRLIENNPSNRDLKKIKAALKNAIMFQLP